LLQNPVDHAVGRDVGHIIGHAGGCVVMVISGGVLMAMMLAILSVMINTFCLSDKKVRTADVPPELSSC